MGRDRLEDVIGSTFNPHPFVLSGSDFMFFDGDRESSKIHICEESDNIQKVTNDFLTSTTKDKSKQVEV